MSKKITLKADNTTLVEDASASDILTTVISTDTTLSGTYGLIQKVGLVGLGMVVQSKRKLGTYNPL